MDKHCSSRMSDVEVIRQYLNYQSTSCFSLLYERYSKKVYSKCISLLKDEALAHDATQEIFTKIFLNLSKFAERAKFSTWVYSITYNYCIDYIRRRKKQFNLFVDDIERAPDLPDEEVKDEELLAMNLKQLTVVLENIPLDDKTILLMKYRDELSIKEIAEIIDKTESAVKMRIKRAKAKAQKTRKKMFEKELHDY
ncbi:MAG: RNA polymerase sigma factor [Bacteroidota bacterium]